MTAYTSTDVNTDVDVVEMVRPGLFGKVVVMGAITVAVDVRPG